ncbi:zinc finger protein Xfin-like [Sabethes cyaneus]|uniref:zinc finger protein Xfin-like n=1 Tax=Sabethes cyaneus TaxID=53552 RepID=UPI00237E889E|nr:zinc finger protein Xfin-like [Sabethes cyaneus]
MVATWCCVPLCNNLAHPKKDHTFYPFPKNPLIRKIWKDRTLYHSKLEGWEAVCCLHFKKHFFKKCHNTQTYLLKFDAVPSQNLPKLGEPFTFPFAPATFKLTKQDAGLHYSVLLRKLRTIESTGSCPSSRPKHVKAHNVSEKDSYLRDYVLQEAFPNLNHEVLSSLLKRYSDPTHNVSIFHSKVNNCITLRYAPSNQSVSDVAMIDSTDDGLAVLAADENKKQRARTRDLADELDFTGQTSFSGSFPNIYRDNFFEFKPRPYKQADKRESIDLSATPTAFLCNKCCKLLPSNMTKTHKAFCDFRLYQCTTCFAGFLLATDLEKHIESLHPKALDEMAAVGAFQCGKCSATFIEMNALIKHIETHQHIDENSVLECGVCGAIFLSIIELRKHFAEFHLTKHSLTLIGQPSSQPNSATTQTNDTDSVTIPFNFGSNQETLHKTQDLANHLKESRGNQTPAAVESSSGGKVMLSSSITLSEADLGGPEGTYDIFLCKQCPARYRTFKDFCIHFKVSAHQLVKLCTFCEMGFTDEADYNEHINTHDSEQLFRCNLCVLEVENFETLQKLHDHRIKIHPEASEPVFCLCEICHKIVYRPTMAEHMAIHVEKEKTKITISTEPQKTSPIQLPRNEKILSDRKCRICNMCMSREMLQEHESSEHPESYCYNCAICDAGYYKQHDLKQHVAQKHKQAEIIQILGPRLYRLVKANKTFYYECKACLGDFTNARSAVGHIKATHFANSGKNIQKFVKVQKAVKADSSNSVPSNPHHSKRPCPVCGHWIPKKEHPSHLQTHPDEFPFACVLCDRQFRNQSNLSEHISKEHTEEERYDFIASERNYLVFNIADFKYYECRLCRTEFLTKEGCRVHMRSHSPNIDASTTIALNLYALYYDPETVEMNSESSLDVD